MGKLIAGLILLGLFVMTLAGSSMEGQSDEGLGAAFLIFAIPGTVLTILGGRFVSQYNQVVNSTAMQLHEQGYADSAEIAYKSGVPIPKVNRMLQRAKMKGEIDYKADIR